MDGRGADGAVVPSGRGAPGASATSAGSKASLRRGGWAGFPGVEGPGVWPGVAEAGGRAPGPRLLEAELHVLLELAHLFLELAILELELLDLARHRPDLILEPAQAHDHIRGVLCNGGRTGKHQAGDEKGIVKHLHDAGNDLGFQVPFRAPHAHRAALQRQAAPKGAECQTYHMVNDLTTPPCRRAR